jgi:hypothetical protein
VQNTNAEQILTNPCRESALKQLADLMVKHWLEIGLFQTCLNCSDWSIDRCTKFNQRPPDRVIVCGCEYHSDIPF